MGALELVKRLASTQSVKSCPISAQQEIAANEALDVHANLSYPHPGTGGEGGGPLPGVVELFQYFETILSLVESVSVKRRLRTADRG